MTADRIDPSTYEPELRDGPPWIMDEMIGEEVDLPTAIASSESVTSLWRHLDEAEKAGDRITICGCGTSEHAARAIRSIVAEARPDATLRVRDSFEVGLAPDPGFLLAVSHSAGTAATVAAAKAARDDGTKVVMLTAVPENAPEGVEAVGTPLFDRSWCHTVAYVSPMLTAALGADLDEATARSIIKHELDARNDRKSDAETLTGCNRLLIIGSGVDEITASELALKIEEAAHVPCTPMGVEKVLHGHLPAADERTGLVMLRFDPASAEQRDARFANAAEACSVLGMPQVTLGSSVTTTAEALLAGAVALQLLTVELATTLGLSPDLIRREEPSYKKVAEVAQAD